MAGVSDICDHCQPLSLALHPVEMADAIHKLDSKTPLIKGQSRHLECDTLLYLITQGSVCTQQEHILKACHSDPTDLGHTKTYKISE